MDLQIAAIVERPVSPVTVLPDPRLDLQSVADAQGPAQLILIEIALQLPVITCQQDIHGHRLGLLNRLTQHHRLVTDLVLRPRHALRCPLPLNQQGSQHQEAHTEGQRLPEPELPQQQSHHHHAHEHRQHWHLHRHILTHHDARHQKGDKPQQRYFFSQFVFHTIRFNAAKIHIFRRFTPLSR